MKLKDYLDGNGIKYSVFANKLGMNINTLYNIFKGGDAKLSTAFKIMYLTKGEVTFEDLKPINFKMPTT